MQVNFTFLAKMTII